MATTERHKITVTIKTANPAGGKSSAGYIALSFAGDPALLRDWMNQQFPHFECDSSGAASGEYHMYIHHNYASKLMGVLAELVRRSEVGVVFPEVGLGKELPYDQGWMQPISNALQAVRAQAEAVAAQQQNSGH